MDFESESYVPMEHYLKMIGLKTAVLIACAAKMGAIIAEAPEESCELLYRYGYDLGLAFQVADDWLDTYGDPAVFGKAIGGDILNNKKSWLMTRAFEKASAQTREQLLAAMDMPTETEEQKVQKIAAVKEIYAGLGLEEEAKQEIIRLHNQAIGYISQLSLAPQKAEMLENYAKKLLGRAK
jgi:geranylgeranyl diphosphate synthase type II